MMELSVDPALRNEDRKSFCRKSTDFGIAGTSSSHSDESMGDHTGITPPLRDLSNNNAFYRTPGVLKFRRPCAPSPVLQDVIFRLPDDCLLRVANELILPDLVNMMKSCKRFNTVGAAASKWKAVDFADHTIPFDFLKKTIQLGTNVIRLCGTNITRNGDEDDEPLLPSRLTHVDATRLSRNDISQSFLSRLILSSSFLTHLSLSNCVISLEVATHLSHLDRLSHLDLSMCDNLTPYHLSLILQRSGRYMEELNVSCSQIGREGGMVIASLCSRSLLRLDLSGSAPFVCPEDSIDDEVVATLVDNCPNIWELHLSDSPNISEVAFQKVLTLLDLESLSLSRCYGIHPMEYLKAGTLSQLCVYGVLAEDGIQTLRTQLASTRVNDLELAISSVARPTPPPSVTSLWGMKVNSFNRP